MLLIVLGLYLLPICFAALVLAFNAVPRRRKPRLMISPYIPPKCPFADCQSIQEWITTTTSSSPQLDHPSLAGTDSPTPGAKMDNAVLTPLLIIGPAVSEVAARLLRGPMPYYGLNLSLLWRCARRPPGADPSTWATVAGHLLTSYSMYAKDIDADLWIPEPNERSRSLWAKTDGVLDTIEPLYVSKEDVTTIHPPIALAYAVYLDSLISASLSQGRAS